MSLKLSVPGESQVTRGTAVGFLSSVMSHMKRQIRSVVELFPALRAVKRLLPGVNQHVWDQLIFTFKSFTTDGAAERFLLPVDQQMFGQTSFAVESFPTL